ncbi:hypothetical protein [Agarivorans sp. QJM3NY_33]|uniref:hypothetical protein n=1 Tax=Agarivorans sp. QJM3NY_33 TaxID=3421432 RepID=UPI003F6D583A
MSKQQQSTREWFIAVVFPQQQCCKILVLLTHQLMAGLTLTGQIPLSLGPEDSSHWRGFKPPMSI